MAWAWWQNHGYHVEDQHAGKKQGEVDVHGLFARGFMKKLVFNFIYSTGISIKKHTHESHDCIAPGRHDVPPRQGGSTQSSDHMLHGRRLNKSTYPPPRRFSTCWNPSYRDAVGPVTEVLRSSRSQIRTLHSTRFSLGCGLSEGATQACHWWTGSMKRGMT
jgi:hypothetical protein